MKTDELKNLNISLDKEKEQQLLAYSKMFLQYNAHTNLISKNDEKVLFEKHIFDSLAINLCPQIKECKNLMDIGTGGGFPAIPIALIFPQINVLGVDSITKKINFINQLAQNLEAKNLSAIACRTEELNEKYRESFDIVTSRAVAPLNIILEYAVPYIKTNGYFVAYKSKIVNEEIENAQNALKTLNCEIKNIINYQLPLDENFDRNLVIIKKIKATPRKFPRKTGMAKTNPL